MGLALGLLRHFQEGVCLMGADWKTWTLTQNVTCGVTAQMLTGETRCSSHILHHPHPRAPRTLSSLTQSYNVKMSS